jgi:hypothetical protein
LLLEEELLQKNLENQNEDGEIVVVTENVENQNQC